MLTLNDGRSELWQWDTGRTVSVDADCSQVHFSNKVFGRSIDVDVVDGIAIIPDILLQADKDLAAWAFAGTPENGYTKISKVFKVNRRNKPSDYVFTPPEQTTLGEILERLDDLESVKVPDAIKNAVEDYLEQNPVEVPVQSVNGQTGEVKLKAGDVGAISQDDLQEATNEALAQAKESGEFDGPQGPKGDHGEKGDKGDTGATGAQGEPGKDGADGKDGTSATHRWNGTVLTITSASGTSSADLKGDPGEPGVDGADYILTDADKTEIAEMAAELVEVPDSGGNVAYDEEQELTEEQKAQARANIGAQPVGEYLTEVPEGYAKNEDIKKVDRKVDTLREVVSKFHSNIVCDSKGEVITVSDASDMELAGLRIFGKTTQDGTPTPEAPVPLVNVGNGGSITVKVGTSETDENPQTLTISTPNGLHGIPVASGGNYTDASGQQWICDEVDFARGKYVQRFTKLVFDGSADEGWLMNGPTGAGIYRLCCDKYNRVLKPSPNTTSMAIFLCSSFEKTTARNTWIRKADLCAIDNTAYIYFVRTSFTSADTVVSDWLSYLKDHPMTIVAELAAPIETDLAPAEMAAYAAIHTNYPNTTVFNDGGAGMEVKYVADTKLYIDKKFAELSAALLNQ